MNNGPNIMIITVLNLIKHGLEVAKISRKTEKNELMKKCVALSRTETDYEDVKWIKLAQDHGISDAAGTFDFATRHLPHFTT